MDRNAAADSPAADSSLDTIAADAATLAPPEAAALLCLLPDSDLATVLRALSPSVAEHVLNALGEDRRRAVLAAAPADEGRQWARNLTYPDDSVGRIDGAPARGVPARPHRRRRPSNAFGELVKTTFVTYGFVTDGRACSSAWSPCATCCSPSGRPPRERHAAESLLPRGPSSPLLDAARLVGGPPLPRLPRVRRRGTSGRASSAAGPSSRSRRSRSAPRRAPWSASRRKSVSRLPGHAASAIRHPWLQLNLLTAFVAAAVVGVLPGHDRPARGPGRLSSRARRPVRQHGLPGPRRDAAGHHPRRAAPRRRGRLVFKEGLLGFLNGALVGVTAGLGMYVVATAPEEPARGPARPSWSSWP